MTKFKCFSIDIITQLGQDVVKLFIHIISKANWNLMDDRKTKALLLFTSFSGLNRFLLTNFFQMMRQMNSVLQAWACDFVKYIFDS